MKVNVTARHLELTPSLKEYSERRLMQVKKYTGKITTAHVILNVEKDRHIAEVILGVSRNKINAKAVADDMYAAIDLVMDKVVKQLKRHMDRVKEHKDIPNYAMVENLVKEERKKVGENGLQLEKVKEKRIEKQSIEEALRELEEKNLNFWVFEDLKDNHINIVYKRDHSKYGMLIIK